MSPERLYISLAFVLIPYLSFAQRNPQPYFRNYSTDDGLPSPEVYCAFEDSRGYMWFGTDNGAARFDGYEFKVFGSKEGLMSNVILDIYEDIEGNIWFATMTGDAYIFDNDTIVPYQFNELIHQFDDRYEDGRLAHIYEDGKTLFTLKGFGFLKIDILGNTDTLTGQLISSNVILHEDGFRQTEWTTNSRVHYKLYDSLYVANVASNSSYYEIYTDKGVIQKKLSNQRGPGLGAEATKLNSGEYLIYVVGDLHCLADTNLAWTIENYPGTNEITHEKDGGIWFCQRNLNGLRRYDNLEELRKLNYQEYLRGNSITQIWFDSKNNLWATTLESGVFRCSDLNLVTYNMDTGLEDEYVITASIQNDSIVHFGTFGGHIYSIDSRRNKIINQLKSLYPNDRYSLYYDRDDEILYHGFSKLNGGSWDFPLAWHINYKKYARYHYATLDRIEKYSSDVLIGCSQAGFYLLDQTNHFVTLKSVDFKRERTYAIHKNNQGGVWLGTANGIFHFDFKDSTYYHPGVPHPAFRSRVEDIDEMPDSTLVLGSKGFGVIFWKGDKIIQVSDDDGLTSNMLEDIHVDDNGIVWAGTLNGLNKITFDENGEPNVRSFTVFNGLPSNEIYQIDSYEGKVWLCTKKGLVKFHERPKNMESPAPIIQRIKVNDEEVQNMSGHEYGNKKNNFEFNFLTINYRMDGEIQYRYKINENNNWQYTRNLSVNYPALPPGDYRFEVQSQNEDRYWSASAMYEFAILPPWWQTWWFRTLIIGALALGGFSFYKFRTRQLKRENEIQRQISELEKSALQAQMNPHFIFNSLNSIQHFILKNDRKKAVEYLARFAKLVRHNLEASRWGVVSLENEMTMLDNYLALEKERFDQRFDYEISMDEKLENDFIEFPCMLIQPFVENAVIHGMADKKEGGKINIHFGRENHSLKVNITDNGSGFRKDEKDHQTPRHKSAGMSITKKRLELLGTDPEHAIHIDELKNKDGVTEGTEVSISIKTKTT